MKIPLAATSGVTAGLLSNTDYSTFSNKQDALGYTPLNPANNLNDIGNAATARSNLGLSTAGGDLSGTLPNPTIAKLQSKDITLSSLANKNVLFYDGAQWINKQLSITDISGITMNDYVAYSAIPANCAASKTMVFITPTNTFTCSDIAIANTQVSGLAASATTDTTNATNITSGTLNAARLPSSITDAMWSESSGNVHRTTGNVGIGTATARSHLDVNGTLLVKPSVNNTTAVVDFSLGNLQHTTSDCGSFDFHNMQDGGSYTFTVKGTNSALCSFDAFSDAGTTAITVHMPPDHDVTTAGKHTVYTLLVQGADVYVSWIPGY